MDSSQSQQLAVALVCLQKGWYVFPLAEKSKQPDSEFAPHGFNSSTNDPNKIQEWWSKRPNSNIGIDLGRSNLTVLDFDKGAPPEELHLPETLWVKTSRGTHVYFNGLAEQRKMVFNGMHLGEIKSAGGYVLAPASVHPDGSIYTIAHRAAVAPIPNGLIEALRPTDRVIETPRNEHDMIPHGHIHPWLVSEAGRMRNNGLTIEEIELVLLRKAHEQCMPPLDDAKIRQVARSFSIYPAGKSTNIILSQPPTTVLEEPVELPTYEEEPYPHFPHYVMEGTSLYEKFVKPVCEQNSRIDYFMWLPAMILLLNYIGPKVKIASAFGPSPFKGSIYAVLIGRKGKTNKSSSVRDAMRYFNYCGCLGYANKDTKNAEGKSLTWSAGSPEGLGLEMEKTNCKNAILYYDELSQLVAKASIDSSALSSALLLMYESQQFGNSVKATRERYSIDPDTYCTSLIACTTDMKFSELWSKLAGQDTGLDDRFFFILQPSPPPIPRLQVNVETVLGSIETKKLIDKALQKAVYSFEDTAPFEELVQIENRYAARAEKWALALAIDLGLDEIDSECAVRAVDIVKYEMAVKKFLKSYEATTREGQIQQEIRRTLEISKGLLSKRELMRRLHADRHGTTLWTSSYLGLIKHGIIREEGGRGRSDPVMVRLLIKRDLQED